MAEPTPYPTSGGVENAIKDAAKRAAAADPGLNVINRIQLEYFHRFLCRVFSEGDRSEWVLKGGTGMLARVPSARSTRDIDLYREGFPLALSLDELIRLAAIDLGDHFRFEYSGHTNVIGTDAQPDTEGYRVKFTIFVGLGARGTLTVDLVVGAGLTGDVITRKPATALELPRLPDAAYRLYPVVDQIADKVMATLSVFNNRPSSVVSR